MATNCVRRRPRAVAVLVSMVLVVACNLAHAAAPVMQRITFPSLDLDANGAPLMLDALLFRPADGEGKRIPAVVALHGCGGMYSILKSRRNDLSIRHQKMAELLVNEGYAVLFPDSFRSRGREEICTERNADRTLTVSRRRLDALGALAYLQERSDIAVDRIAVLGWSHGGSTVLFSVNDHATPVQRFRESDAAPFFRAAIAFYPGCFESANAKEGYAPATSLLLLVGASDDWTSPRPCIALVDRLKRASMPASIVVYPDTYHGFDGPSSQPRMRLDVPNGVHPGQGVTVAVNAAAREDAYARVKGFLHTAFAQ